MKQRAGILDWIERIGNGLPDPTTLFLLGTIFIMLLSDLAVRNDWTVEQRLPQQKSLPVLDANGTPLTDDSGRPLTQPVLDENGKPAVVWTSTGQVFKAVSLLDRDGLFWVINKLVDNFMAFPPLGVVLVGMLGVGIAERTGLIAALLKAFMLVVPGMLLTPATIFIGIMSSLTSDAGYVILPPLAAAIYKSVGRSPLAGVAAVFAGVSAGFNANLLITSLDPMLAEFTAKGAQVIAADYAVNPACNWAFLFVSTIVITLAGWAVTAFFIERRLADKPVDHGGPAAVSLGELEKQKLLPAEKKGMAIAGVVFLLLFVTFLLMTIIDSAPLFGIGVRFERWVEAIVPLLLFGFAIPGIAYGLALKNIRSDKDVARLLIDTMAAMAPIIVLAFFAAQFIAGFEHSGLGRMIATAGGQSLGQAEMPRAALLLAFIGFTIIFNLFIGSMSAKYALFAPIFVPMFMVVSIAPELTQAAYRIGDSVSNVITPLNPYLIIILVYIQAYIPKAGIGTLISTMFPYTVVFTVVWCILLLIWIALGIPLGPDGGLTYNPAV